MATMTVEVQRRQRAVMVRGLRIIVSYVRMHPLPFTLAVLGAAVYAATTVGTTIVLGRVTDSVLVPAFSEGVSARTVAGAVVAITAVALLRAAGIIVRRFCAGTTASRAQRTLRERVVDRYRELPLSYHRAQPTGELLAHVEADVDAATDVLHPLPYSTAVILLLVFATISLLVTDPFLAIIGIGVLPGLAVLNRHYSSVVEPPATAAQKAVGAVSAVAHESIDGALVVKTLGRESAEVERFAAQAAELRRHRIEVGRLRASFEPAFNSLPDLGIVAIIAMGSWRVSTGTITVGTLVQFVSLFQLLAFPMRLIGFVLSDIPRSVVGYERVAAVLAEPLPPRRATRGVHLSHGPLGLRVRDLGFSYGDNRVLDGASFEVAPGQSVAVVGSTGAGKSTLLQLLVHLDDPAAGSIELGGVDLRDVAMEDLRASAAIVFQESFLFAVSVRDNITLDRDIDDARVRAAARLAQADDFVRALPDGYDTVLGERGVTLSGGQRQRIALARALAGSPRLLLLDDATSAVDPTVEAAILAGMRSRLDTTLVVVAYRVSTIMLCDRILLLDGGRIAAAGTHAELLRHPVYDAMVRAYERNES